MEKRIAKEEWVELSKKLQSRVSGHFNPQELEIIGRFIQLAGQGSAFNQVRQE